MTTPFTRTATAIAIVLVGCSFHVAITAERANVKAFGQMMVKDHSEANAELSRIAAEMKIVPPTEIDKKHAELVERLSKLNGAEFDRAYVMAMVEGHQAVAAQLREWTTASRPLGPPPAGDPKAADLARGGPNEEKLTEWAIRALPIVEKHLEHARALQKSE